jgi:subtilisin family serine protease
MRNARSFPLQGKPLRTHLKRVQRKPFAVRYRADLHRRGWTGAGNVVAVIDTGLRPGYPHSAGSVVGCENFVDDNRDGRVDSNDGNCTDLSNDPHGTFVSGLIAAHADFDISGTDLLTSIKQHLPAALKPNGEKTILSLIGGAPRASIYAFRAFGSESTIIEAIDRNRGTGDGRHHKLPR